MKIPFLSKDSKINLILIIFTILCFLFQIFLIIQFKFLYEILKTLFIIEFFLLILLFFKGIKEKKFIIFCIIFILIIRIPFYLHKHGLIFSSDNALEALQAQAIKDTKTAPFFLFEIMGHNGTLKYLLVAFVWDILGKNYLYFLLVQLLLFILFTCLLYRILKPIIDEKILTIFIFSHFMFIEIVFNYSLFIRAGPYLEMLVFFLIGVFLFDFTFENKIKIFLSYYFFLFSIYIHPVGLFFALGFAAVAIIYSIYSKKFLRNLTLMLGGSFAGAFHQLYYLFFKPKPPPTGEWYKIKILTPSSFSFNKIPQYLTDLFVDIKIIFKNIFSLDYSSIINFIDSPGILTSINKALIYFSLLILVCAIFIVILKCVSILRKNLNQNQWVYLFFFILLIIFILKVFLLSPKPFYEPRHNFDLTFIIMLSYLITFSAILKIKRFLSVKSILAFLLLLIFTLPHYYCYLKMTYIKENSYREILSILENNKVKYLAGDFIIAYVIYFLSERKILVSDSIGPVTIPFFYPQMKKRVDKIPRKHKAFIFFSENYPHKKWHKQFTKIMKITILNYLKKRKIKFKIYKLDYFTLIIPFPATCLQ